MCVWGGGGAGGGGSTMPGGQQFARTCGATVARASERGELPIYLPGSTDRAAT